jgi:glycosyltransferase involved in cell wall biosynthesis
MKVVKVVFNAVSHDARVLKEAAALRELDHRVVIVGIQDAQNTRVIETLDNGVVIRRVAWASTAQRPIVWLYLALALATLGIIWLAYQLLVEVVLYWDRAVTFAESFLLITDVLAGVGILVSAWVLWRLWRIYRARAQRFAESRKSEQDNLLKYQAEMELHALSLNLEEPGPGFLRRLGTDIWHVIRRIVPITTRRRVVDLWYRLRRAEPRPMIEGVRTGWMPEALHRWKVVWARERRVRAVLEEELPDVVHAHDVSALTVCAEYKLATGCKLVFDAHEVYDHLAQSEGPAAKINTSVLRRYGREVDLFVTINDSIAHYYKNKYRDLGRAVIVKNATAVAEAFEYDGRLHRAAGISGNRRILLYQGGFAEKRGLMALLSSAEYLSSDWTLVFMGWGRLESAMRRTFEGLVTRMPDLAERVRFVARVPQSELVQWTAGATLGVIPYENAGLNHWFCTPNKLWEYPNAGVPIIASPFPEMRKVIESNGIGWFLTDPMTAKSIAASINALTDDDLAEAKRNCRTFIRCDNWSVYSRRLTKAYEALL